jgi:tetratricopeptide (TPR) repeat protein
MLVLRPGRNDPCPCGSGQKFKHCCGNPAAAAAHINAEEIGALVALVNQGRLGEAEQRTTTLLRVQPAAGILWKILGVALLRQEKNALAALRRAAELLPEDAEAHANLGAELRVRSKWEEALVSLRKSLALQPRNPDALIDAADAQRSLGRLREAVDLYRWALQIDPRRGDAHNNLGNALLELGETAAAVECYKRALELRPQDAQVLCNLGNALRQLGQLEEAVNFTRRALELAPDLGMAHNNLGLLLGARGERDAAIASYRQALRHNPRYVEALSNLGNALREQGQRREALSAYQQAVELDPRRADSHFNVGQALLESRRIQQAADAFRNALSLQPSHTAAHLGLAAVQRVQGLASEAEASCERALVLAPQDPDALVLLGELRADRGQFAQAQELFERVLAANPQFASAYCSIAAHRRMTRDDVAWLQGAQALLASRLPLADELQLRYVLGKYFDEVGAYDEAFSSYQQANELNKRCGGSYDEVHLTKLVGRIMKLCDNAFVRSARVGVSTSGAAASAAARASEEPVFIIGMPRSGTSLTEQILASHPAVFGAGEVAFWDKAFATLAESAPAVEHLALRLADLAREYLDRVRGRVATAPRITDNAALRITDKMPANFFYAGLIHAVFPRARIIHMQRHPLDTCVSVYFQNFFNVSPYANDLNHLAHYYGQYLRIMAHWRSVLPAHALLEVPYEELVQDPERWTRRMLEFIGLPWDPQCLQFYQTERAVITASKWQVRQKINTGSVERWRHYDKHLAPLRHLAPGEVQRPLE